LARLFQRGVRPVPSTTRTPWRYGRFAGTYKDLAVIPWTDEWCRILLERTNTADGFDTCCAREVAMGARRDRGATHGISHRHDPVLRWRRQIWDQAAAHHVGPSLKYGDEGMRNVVNNGDPAARQSVFNRLRSVVEGRYTGACAGWLGRCRRCMNMTLEVRLGGLA